MAEITILYWRDIPSQVVVREGRKNAKILLPDRFQQAIDMAAMRNNAHETDAYLEAYSLLEAGDPGAVQAFATRVGLRPDDRLASFHLKRLLNGGAGTRIELE